MPAWKKGFRSLPASLKASLDSIAADDVKVLVGKIVTVDEVSSGTYSHIGLTTKSLAVSSKWEVVPGAEVGKSSKRNRDGWTVVRTDLPKYKKYFYHDIQNFGDASRNGWSTVAIPRLIYERDSIPPYLFHIEVFVQEQFVDGRIGIVFSIDEIFSRRSPTFADDLLFAVNLLQENTGVCGVVAASNPDFVFTSQLRWDVFPPGNIQDLAMLIRQSGDKGAPQHGVVIERLELFEQFKPTEYLRGLGGNDHYIGAKYADDLVVFENMRHGNALYALYADWVNLSKRPRSEILKLPESQFDRIIHTDGWQNRFAVLMQHQLKQRGIRIRIGRNLRRRN